MISARNIPSTSYAVSSTDESCQKGAVSTLKRVCVLSGSVSRINSRVFVIIISRRSSSRTERPEQHSITLRDLLLGLNQSRRQNWARGLAKHVKCPGGGESASLEPELMFRTVWFLPELNFCRLSSSHSGLTENPLKIAPFASSNSTVLK
jgi:hypothetical protein